MQIKPRALSGTYMVTLEPKMDNRGFFMRTYDENLFQKYKIAHDWVQENQSRSIAKGIIRGLHFQLPPYTESKLVRCTRGIIFDVFVDLRKDSPTFSHWDSIELSEENKKMIFIPAGFAHGFCTLTDNCEVLYRVDNYYHPEAEYGIIWNDATLKIKWPVNKPILSQRDAKLASFADFVERHKGLV